MDTAEINCITLVSPHGNQQVDIHDDGLVETYSIIQDKLVNTQDSFAGQWSMPVLERIYLSKGWTRQSMTQGATMYHDADFQRVSRRIDVALTHELRNLATLIECSHGLTVEVDNYMERIDTLRKRQYLAFNAYMNRSAS